MVIDVGAGTGVLSFFAALSGARRVFAIEASSALSDIIVELSIANGVDDRVVVVNKEVESVSSLEMLWSFPTVRELKNSNKGLDIKSSSTIETGARVDVLISEWMGFYLLHEAMLSSVLFARDNFLKHRDEGGIMLPDRASIYLTIGSMPDLWDEKIGWTLKPFHGLDVSSLAPALLALDRATLIVTSVSTTSVSVASTERLLSLDLWTIQEDQLDCLECRATPVLQSSENAMISQNDTSEQRSLHGFILWFDVEFPSGQSTESKPPNSDVPNSDVPHLDVPNSINRSVFDTSPFSPLSHWKQCVILFEQPMDLIPNLKIFCTATLQRQARCYQIEVEVVDVEEV